MEKTTVNAGDQKQMSDVAMAREYVADIGASDRVKTMIARAYDRLNKMFPHENDPGERWTERRIRGFWNMDAASVKYREMIELHQAAEAVKAERELLKKAREEHAAFIAKTASLRSLLERQDEDFHRPDIAGMGSRSSGMDSAGIEG